MTWASAVAVGALVSSGLLVACASGAKWEKVHIASDYRKPVRVMVTVEARATGVDLREEINEFARVLCEELETHGITARIGARRAGWTHAHLKVTGWDPGDQAKRYFSGFGDGEGHFVVEVELSRPDEATALAGRVRAHVSGGPLGGESVVAVKSAALFLAEAIATGSVDPSADHSMPVVALGEMADERQKSTARAGDRPAPSATASAMPSAPGRTSYSAPSECPSQDAFERLAFGQDGNPGPARGTEQRQSFAIQIAVSTGKVTGTLEIHAADGSVGRREIIGRQCEEVTAALALMVAMAVNPSRAIAPLPSSQEPSRTPSRPATDSGPDGGEE
jgi:hypothetical protein